jgi:hypothetical protein
MVPDDEIEHIYLDDEDSHPTPGQHAHGVEPVENKSEYKKFAMVLLGILLVSSLLTWVRGWEPERFMADFMAVFFITFAAFKFVNIEMFAHAYRQYDIIAKHFQPWAYAFPFVEAFLGFWYLLSEGPETLNILTLIVTGTAAAGVYKEVVQKPKSKFMCACLGNVIRLPLSKVSLVENVAMFAMAALMLIF